MISRQSRLIQYAPHGRDAWSVFGLMLVLHLATLDVHPILHGDDYIAYLANAQALLNHTTYGMPGFLMNTDYAGGADLGQGAYPIGLPLLVLPIVWWAAGSVPAALGGMAALNCALVAGFAGLMVRLAQLLAGRVAGSLAGLVAGLSPFLFDQGGFRSPSEPAFLVVFVLTLLADARLAESGRRGDAAWVGALAAVATLMRVVGVLLIPAVLLAEALRRRRIGATVLLAGGVAAALAVLGLVAMGQDYFIRNVAIFASPGHATVAVHEGMGPRLWQNLRALPGNLSVFWGYGWGGTAPLTGVARLGLQLAGLAVLLAGGAGWLISLRRGGVAMAAFAVLQTAMLLVLPLAQQSPRYYLPVSVLLLLYVLIACDAAGRWRGVGLVLAGLAIGVPMAVNWPGVLAARVADQRYSILEPRMTELAAWVRSATPADRVLLSHRPRTLVMLTGRAASDFTESRADAGFAALVAATQARLLVQMIDAPELVAQAAQSGAPITEASLNAQADAWEVRFFAPAAPPMVFRNARFRVYTIAPPG